VQDGSMISRVKAAIASEIKCLVAHAPCEPSLILLPP
jgi:hypothetical protein